jgi:hypothetical protein
MVLRAQDQRNILQRMASDWRRTREQIREDYLRILERGRIGSAAVKSHSRAPLRQNLRKVTRAPWEERMENKTEISRIDHGLSTSDLILNYLGLAEISGTRINFTKNIF